MVLIELIAVGITAEITTDPQLTGSLPRNIANKTKIGRVVYNSRWGQRIGPAY